MNKARFHSKITSLLLPIGALLAVAVPASAQQTFNVVADTFTSFNSQSTNYGTNTKVNIENDGTDNSDNSRDRVGYFRFDLSTYTGGTISGATFTLYPFEQIAPTIPQNFDVYGIVDGGTSEGFSEGTGKVDGTEFNWINSGYSYTNGQGLTDSANFGDLSLLGSITGVTPADQGGSVSLSSAALTTFLNNDGNDIVSFIVVNTNGEDSFNGFYSKENGSSDGTSLTIVPEPASATLALGLLATLSLVRRRRS